MSSIKNSVTSAAWVVGLAGCVWLGSALRDRADLAQPVMPDGKIQGLLASRDDSEIPAGDFFYELTEKLKKEYVEPIKDEQKLASGAVRGMIGYLGDPKSIYMGKDEFQAFLNARQGKYEGIGADFALLTPTPGAKASRSALQPTPTEESEDPRQEAMSVPVQKTKGKAKVTTPQFPRLTVTSVVPGGPADKAGVKPGDVVDTIDGHWVLNGDLILRFNRARMDFEAKKIDLPALNEIRKEVREKYERALLPLRAKDRLFLGTTGQVKVVWERNGEKRTSTIVKAPSQRPGFEAKGDTILLPFTPGAPDELRKAIAGKQAVTIDLRDNTLGDFEVMRECLAILAPPGAYGVYANDRAEKPVPLSIQKGNANPPKLTLLTASTTRGAAEIFALALSSKGLAKLSGQETGNDRDLYDIVALPDGAGYTLVTAHYKPGLATTRVAENGGTSR